MYMDCLKTECLQHYSNSGGGGNMHSKALRLDKDGVYLSLSAYFNPWSTSGVKV